jgi:hypothetical protein
VHHSIVGEPLELHCWPLSLQPCVERVMEIEISKDGRDG